MDSYDYFNSSSVGKILEKRCLKKRRACHKKLTQTFTINGYSVTWLARFNLVGVHAWPRTVVGALLHRCLWTRLRPPSPRYFLFFITALKKVTSLHICYVQCSHFVKDRFKHIHVTGAC